MFKKKKNTYEELKEEFYSYNKNNNDYEDINKIYKEIKDYYRKQLYDEKLDIRIERIRIERSLGRYIHTSFEFIISYFIAIIASILTLMLQQIEGASYNNLSYPIYAFILFFIMLTLPKSVSKEKPKGIMLNISLAVLDDLEEEIQQYSIASIKESTAKKNEFNNNNLISKKIMAIKRFLGII